MYIVDPPSGWQYGFPREFDFEASSPDRYDEEFAQWFLDAGYPQALIDQGMLKHCRYWSADVVGPEGPGQFVMRQD